MHEAALLSAAQPVPAVVLGMLLRPLSLGHILQFERYGIIQSAQRGTISPEQLTAGVLICCQTWEQLAGQDSDRWMPLKLWIWRKRLVRSARAYARAGLGYFAEETKTFITYLSSGSNEFPLSEIEYPDRKKSRSPGCPGILRLNQWTMTTLRLTEPEAWDYPYGLAKMRWACHWEMEGGLDVRNEDDEVFEQYIARQEAMGATQLQEAR